MNLPDIDQSIRWPAGAKPGVGIIGCGGIVRGAHVSAYQKYGVPVLGVCDIVPENAQKVAALLDGPPSIYAGVEELLANPDIGIVDIATHPQHRAELVRQALAAGKHVLVQKPSAVSLKEARELVALTEQSGLKLAVNQNGRWAPPWRAATDLIATGTIGTVGSVAHVFDTSFAWTTGSAFDDIPHWLIYDYAIHWIDISRCWLPLDGKITVSARSWRLPWQPAESKTPWGLDLSVCRDDLPVLKIYSGGVAKGGDGHPFYIQGSAGVIRGSVLGRNDQVELDVSEAQVRYPLTGKWFPDGFGGAMAELMCAIEEDREPSHSGRNNLLSLELVLGACESAGRDGVAVALS